jgi:hypothetical protein
MKRLLLFSALGLIVAASILLSISGTNISVADNSGPNIEASSVATEPQSCSSSNSSGSATITITMTGIVGDKGNISGK